MYAIKLNSPFLNDPWVSELSEKGLLTTQSISKAITFIFDHEALEYKSRLEQQNPDMRFSLEELF